MLRVIQVIESWLDDLDKGKAPITEHFIRGKLSTIHEHAKAADAEIEKIKAELTHAERRITELELKLHEQQPAAQGDRLSKLAERVLRILFKSPPETFFNAQQLASVLGVETTGEAQHACDVLFKAKMIEGYESLGYYIIPDGRAYVMEHGLNK